MSTNLILARILAAGRERRGDRPRRALRVPRLADPGRDLPQPRHPTPGQAINPWDVEDLPRSSHRRSSNTCSRSTASSSAARSRTAPTTSNPRDHSQLSLAIRAVYRRCRLTGELPREMLLQEELYRRCEEARSDGNVELAGQLAQLAEGLHDYVGDGAGTYLADRPTSVPDDSPLVIFDTRDVGDARAGAAMFTIVEHLAAPQPPDP